MKVRKVRYKSSITVLDKILNLSKILKDYGKSSNLSVALNEGITEWIKQKAVSGNDTYDMEVNIVNQIENIVGAKNIIEIVNKRPKEMKDLLNMNRKEFVVFSNQMDYIFFLSKLKNKIENGLMFNEQFDKLEKFNQEEGKYLNEEIKFTTLDIQNQLVKKLIIPYFAKEQQNKGESFERALKCIKLIQDYCQLSNAYTDMYDEFMNTNEYKELKDVLDKIIIQYTKQNFQNIDNWDREKVFEIDKKLSLYGYVDFNEDYEKFTNKLASRIEEIRLKEDAIILDSVKHKVSDRDKIDVNLLINDYNNEYSSYDINDKVRELILKRKLTNGQREDLIKEVQVYIDCGKVISKKDIKKQKNQDGHIEYYVVIDGERYTNEHLKKMKNGRKFLNSKQYEVIEKEDEEYQMEEDKSLSIIDEKEHGKITKFINFLKERFFKKKSETMTDTIDSPVEDFRESLKVKSKRVTSQAKRNISSKNIEKDER